MIASAFSASAFTEAPKPFHASTTSPSGHAWLAMTLTRFEITWYDVTLETIDVYSRVEASHSMAETF